MKFECVGETRTMSEGELCIIAPETNHTIVADDQSIIICIVIKKSTFHTSFFDILRYDSLLLCFAREKCRRLQRKNTEHC